jgi:hypothetical protein
MSDFTKTLLAVSVSHSLVCFLTVTEILGRLY